MTRAAHSPPATLTEYLENERRDLADACTRCGRCVEVCPVIPHAGLGAVEPAGIVGGVLDLLISGEPMDAASEAWTSQCNGCGDCIPACPEGVNPRRMISLAQQASAAGGRGVPDVFRKMAQAVRLMAAMQLVPDDLARVLHHRPTRKAPVVFYLGCNALRTPNVLLDAMTVLDTLEVDYEVAGGPGACCGIIHTRSEGKIDAGGKVAASTLVRFERFGAERVLSWCPSCQLQLTETLDGFGHKRVDMDHVTSFLLEHRAELEQLWTTPVPRRVVLHAHDGFARFGQNVETLLDSIPGLERLETIIESGYTCGAAGSDRSPGRKADDRERLFAAVRDAGADTVVSLYHGCHRSLIADGRREGFEVVNFTSVLVEALGMTPHADGFAAMSGGEPAAVTEEARRFLEANGIDLEPGWLETNLDDLLSMAEYRGGLECLGGRH